MHNAGELSLEVLLKDYLPRWSLELDGAPITTPSSHIVFVGSRFGPAVLKLFRPPYEEARSSAALLHFGDVGPRVFQLSDRALLMERIRPGTPLAELSLTGRDDEATAIICDIAARLRTLPTPAETWTSVEDWGQGFARHRRGPGHALLPPGLIDEGERVYFDLCATQSERVLLHGDLHHHNILLDNSHGWLAIDPKGIIGEPAFEVVTALKNPVDRPDVFTDAKLLARRIDLMSARLGYDGERLLRWFFAQLVLSLIWFAEDGFGAAEIGPRLQLVNISRHMLA